MGGDIRQACDPVSDRGQVHTPPDLARRMAPGHRFGRRTDARRTARYTQGRAHRGTQRASAWPDFTDLEHRSGTVDGHDLLQFLRHQPSEELRRSGGGRWSFWGVLSIKVGDTAPKLAAGGDSPPGDDSGCRVCHLVAAFGSRLVTQRGENYSVGSAFDLSASGPTTETQMQGGILFPGLYPDGAKELDRSGLRTLPDGAPLASTGFSDIAIEVISPVFSPDGTKVAFSVAQGPQSTIAGAQLVAASFDDATNTFSNPVMLIDNTAAAASNPGYLPGWPAFLPTGDALLFHQQLAAPPPNGAAGDVLHTWMGARAEVWWTHVSNTMPTRLNRLNGRDANGQSYLPVGEGGQVISCDSGGQIHGGVDADHPDDTTLNYEPTVLPIVATRPTCVSIGSAPSTVESSKSGPVGSSLRR